MIEFFDLPNEIIQRIFNYVPHESLRPLVDIKPIRNYVLHSMYPELCIGAEMLQAIRSYKKDTDQVVRNVDECIAFLESTPAIRPKLFYFTQPLDAIIFVTKYPQHLRGAKIALSFQDSTNSSKLMDLFCANYLNNPFPVDQLLSLDLRYLELDGMSSLSKDVTYLCESFEKRIDIKKLSSVPSSFPNLTRLDLSQLLMQENLKYLPRQLKFLKCKIKESRDSSEYSFPDSLTGLEIDFTRDRLKDELNIDVSSLKNLQKLTVDQNFDTKGAIALNRPVNLKFLTIDEKMRPINNLGEMCPCLIELRVSKIISEVNPTDTWVQSYPQTLQVISIPCGEIFESGSNSVISSASEGMPTSEFSTATVIEPASDILSFLPRNLRTLELEGNDRYDYNMFLDFEETDFVELDALEIKFAGNITIYGELPLNLTKLTLECLYIHNFDLNQLVNLKNLRELSLSYLKDVGDFSFDFQESLLKLVFRHCDLPNYYITSPNLQELKISVRDFSILDDSIVTIPQSVKRLSSRGSFINQFLLTLPDGLEALDLNVNSLESITNLPNSLRHLSCSINNLGNCSGDCFEFPMGLESLEIGVNGINEDWIEALNLNECVNLKILNLYNNQIEILDLNHLPKSLIQLDLFNNSIHKIKGTFKDFTNLEEINFQSNDLGGFFETINNLDTFFGENIKYIDLDGNHFTQENVKVVYDELVKYPKFMYLNVDKNVTPQVSDSLELWDSRIGWSRDTD